MSQTNHDGDPEQIDTTSKEDAELLVADPDDYHETQRLREIHDARREVMNVLHEIDGWASTRDHNRQTRDLAHAVAGYVTELLPLMRRTDYEPNFPEKLPYDSMYEFSVALGNHDGDMSYSATMFVFQEANEFLAEIKPLIQENENNEWEI